MGREAQRISRQHRALDELHAVVAERLEAADHDGTRLAFRRFADALEAHFSLEEGLYFPALHGLRPDLEEPLTRLAREHGELREGLQGVEERLEAADLPGAGTRLDATVSALALHEREEERILGALERPRA